MKKFFKTLTLAFALLLSSLSFNSCASIAGNNDNLELAPHSGESIFNQLQRKEVLEMTLVAELDSLIQFRKTEDYSRAILSYENEQGTEQVYQIKVKPRGKFRRMVCDFPPLKLKFSKDELEAAGLEPFNELKLVTHCLDDPERSKELIMREYLAYKMYNELTPNSFKVQLVKITYKDKDDKSLKMTRWGFLMEDKEELASRMNAVECECMGKTKDAYHAGQEKLASVFQYMIGNTDWSLEMNRNVVLMTMNDGRIVPVPYDFDFSMMVGAPYMRPNSSVNQTPNMERVYMGNADSVNEIYSTLAYFRTKEDDLQEIVYNFRWLEQESKDEITAYLDTFFNLIKNEANVSEKLFSSAREVGR